MTSAFIRHPDRRSAATGCLEGDSETHGRGGRHFTYLAGRDRLLRRHQPTGGSSWPASQMEGRECHRRRPKTADPGPTGTPECCSIALLQAAQQ